MIKKQKTILFVMPRLPYPALSGRKTSLYHYCRILSEELGYRLVVAAFLESGDDPSNMPNFIDRLIVLDKISVVSKFMTILKASVFLKKWPMQVSLFWSKNAKKTIDNIIEEEKPDIVIGDMVRSTEYIKNVKVYRIADLDDRISLRYQRQLNTDLKGINPYGAFLGSVPKLIQRIMLFNPIKKLVVKNEINLLRRYELQIGKICEKTIFVAKEEVKQFNKELGINKAIAVPIGVDIDFFSYRKTGLSGNYIGFLGAMNVAHNDNAVRHFVLNILPHILKKQPDVKFLVIGGGVTDDLKKLSSNHVEFVGRVDDVRVYLQNCKVFVCPMKFGSGIKTKILEAMSLGLPVVTTTIGAENIDAINGKDWIIADEDDSFAEAVISLINDDKKRESMGQSGSHFIKNNFTWDIAREQFIKLFADMSDTTKLI